MPPERYIPAATSELKGIEDSLTKAMDGIADLVGTMSREGFSEKTVQAMTSADNVLADLDQLLKSVNRQNIPQRAATTIEKLLVAANKAGTVHRIVWMATRASSPRRSDR